MKINAAKMSACAKILIDTLKKNDVDFIINGGEKRLPGHFILRRGDYRQAVGQVH